MTAHDARRRAGQLHLPAALPGADRAHGWRDALLILAVVLAVVTVPLHALVLRAAATAPIRSAGRRLGPTRARRLRSRGVLAAVGGVLARHLEHDRDDGPRDPVPARARLHAAASPRSPSASSASRRSPAGCCSRRSPRGCRAPTRPRACSRWSPLGIAARRQRATRRPRCSPASCCSAWATGWPRSRAPPRSPTSTASAPTARSQRRRRDDHRARAPSGPSPPRSTPRPSATGAAVDAGGSRRGRRPARLPRRDVIHAAPALQARRHDPADRPTERRRRASRTPRSAPTLPPRVPSRPAPVRRR